MNETPTIIKIQLKSIWLHQAEGLISALSGERTVKSFAEADSYLQRIANNRDNWGRLGEPIGYMKTDFKVEWEDGQTYSGRYDVHFQENCSVANQIKRVMRWHGGGAADCELAEHKMTRERYQQFLTKTLKFDEAAQREHLEFLEKYALSDSDAAPALPPEKAAALATAVVAAARPKESLAGKRVQPMCVFRAATRADCSNGGISSKVDTIYAVQEDGFLDAENVPREQVFVKRTLGREPNTETSLRPIDDKPGVGPMFGGNLAHSSDSRVRTIYRIHDRWETPEEYASND